MVNLGVYLNQEIKLHYTNSHKFTTLCYVSGDYKSPLLATIIICKLLNINNLFHHYIILADSRGDFQSPAYGWSF